MLIKFEKIKVLEDFYNKYHKDDPIYLEIEVTDEEMHQTIDKINEHESRAKKDIKEKRIMISHKFMKLFRYLLGKRGVRENSSMMYALLYWKCYVVNKQAKEERT
jgi:hypothetical protein